jgi:Glycosyl transferase family 2
MNLVGLMPVRNEDWILGLSARVALMWCDRLVILNHASTDRTGQICNELMRECAGDATEYPGGRIRVITLRGEQWDEMQHRQKMLDWARENSESAASATHIALIDCDEILTGNLIGNIREHVAALSIGQMLTLPLYNLRGGLNRYHLNGIWGQRTVSVAFKDVNTAAWKGNTFHHREPHGVQWVRVNPVQQGDGGVMHLWASSLDRLRAKHRLYRVTERVRWPEKAVSEIEREYAQSEAGRPWIGDTPDKWTFADVPEAWWTLYQGLMGHVKLENEPWQNAEADRIIELHGRDFFAGLSV